MTPGLTTDEQAHRDSPDAVGLTDADRRALAAMARYGLPTREKRQEGLSRSGHARAASICPVCHAEREGGVCPFCDTVGTPPDFENGEAAAEEFLYRTVERCG